MGDNLYMIGATRFLLKFYNKVHLLCKNKYYPNVKLFFVDEPNIIFIPFDERDENGVIESIIKEQSKNDDVDVFVCGVHKTYLQSKITNKEFLEYTVENNNDSLDYDTLTNENYDFLKGFYEDMKLNLTIFVKYFHLPSTEESIELYNSVKKYNIVFMQYESSNKIKLNISHLLNKYLHDDKTILLCNDVNLYEGVENANEEKHSLCKKFVLNKLIHYVDTIKNSQEIYIIDSCFTGIVLPLLKQQKLKAHTVRIIRREVVDTVVL
jgi:hypothetical protein